MRYDQSHGCAEARAFASEAAAAEAQRFEQVERGHADGRDDAEEQACEKRRGEGEENVGGVERDGFYTRCAGGEQAHEEAEAEECRGEAHDARGQAEDDAFRQKLLNETARRCAERAANGDLALAGGGAGKHHIGNIRTGNEKDEADRAKEKQEARTHGSGFGFEQRYYGHVRSPTVGHLPGELMYKDAAEAAQFGLRLAGGDAGSEATESVQRERIPWIVNIGAVVGDRDEKVGVGVGEAYAGGEHADDAARDAVNA